MSKLSRGLIRGQIILLFMCCGIFVVCNTNSASAATSTLSLSIDNNTVSMNIIPLNVNGTFRQSATSTISASTNNATGYTLSIAAPEGSNTTTNSKLINAADSTATLSSITSPTTEAQFKALNGTAYNGMWGYLPSKHCTDNTTSSCGSNSDFLPAPTISGDIIDKTTSANTTPNTYTIAIGARVDSTVKTGSYANTFVVRLVAEAIPYSITYVDNLVGSMPTDVIGTASGNTVTLSSNIPTRAGYTFIGWCSVVPTAGATGTDTCSGTTYYPAGSSSSPTAITIDQTGGSNDHTLYAMWENSFDMSAHATYLQDFNSMSTAEKAAVVMGMKPETNYTLTDSRDSQDYSVAKLKDGNIWMTKNLNIAGGTTLTCDKTDCDGGYVLPSDQGWDTNTPGKLPASDTAGFNNNNGDNYAYVYNSGNTTGCGASGQNTPCFSYYSWDAATLGSGRNIATEATDAPYSICPKGWRLPTSGKNDVNDNVTGWKRGDFYRLLTAYGANLENASDQSTNTFYNNAGPGTVANFLLAGYYYGGSFSYGGSAGFYWSSTSSGSTSDVRHLLFSTGYVNSAYYNYRYLGFSVRCLLK